MNPYNLSQYTKQEIQEENVRRGGARCSNELRQKTEAKFIKLWNKEHECKITIDEETFSMPIPHGKTKTDLHAHILQFFAQQQ